MQLIVANKRRDVAKWDEYYIFFRCGGPWVTQFPIGIGRSLTCLRYYTATASAEYDTTSWIFLLPKLVDMIQTID